MPRWVAGTAKRRLDDVGDHDGAQHAGQQLCADRVAPQEVSKVYGPDRDVPHALPAGWEASSHALVIAAPSRATALPKHRATLD